MSNEVLSEAALFFVVFAILSIISLIISKKNAKKFELENSLEDRKEKVRRERLIERHINNSLVTIKGKAFILTELSKSVKKNILSEKDFQILKFSLDKM